MRAAGGQIYEGGKFSSPVMQSARGQSNLTQNLANRGVQEQLDRNKQEALTLYEQGLKLSAAQSMESIYNEYQNDPEGLKAELGKLSEKMTAEIPDMGMKVAFRANFITQSGSLVNRAQANYDKIQYQKKKSSYFDTIQANNKSIQTALSNAFNGTGTADDLVNYQRAIKQNLNLINARNDDGTYMFSDAQRLSMSNAVDKLASQSFTDALSEMDDDKRNQVLTALNNDSMIIMQGEDEGEVKQLNLKDAFSPDVYADMKKSAKDLDYKIKSQQVKEFNLNKRYAEMQLILHPSNENYKIWESYNPNASETTKKKMQQAVGNIEPAYDVVTTYDDYSEALMDVKGLDKLIDDDDVKNGQVLERAYDIVAKIRRSPLVVEGEEKYGINKQDQEKLEEIVSRKLTDPLFNDLMSSLPDMDSFKSLRYQVAQRMDTLKQISDIEAEPLPVGFSRDTMKERFKKLGQRTERISDLRGDLREKIQFTKNTKINKIGNDTVNAMVGYLAGVRNLAPDSMEQAKKEMTDMWKEQMLKAYAVKYDNIPDLQKKLKENESIVNINGLPYKYIGFSNNKPQFELIGKGK